MTHKTTCKFCHDAVFEKGVCAFHLPRVVGYLKWPKDERDTNDWRDTSAGQRYEVEMDNLVEFLRRGR